MVNGLARLVIPGPCQQDYLMHTGMFNTLPRICFGPDSFDGRKTMKIATLLERSTEVVKYQRSIRSHSAYDNTLISEYTGIGIAVPPKQFTLLVIQLTQRGKTCIAISNRIHSP